MWVLLESRRWYTEKGHECSYLTDRAPRLQKIEDSWSQTPVCGSADGFRGAIKKNMSGVIFIQLSKNAGTLTGTWINIVAAKTLKSHPQAVLHHSYLLFHRNIPIMHSLESHTHNDRHLASSDGIGGSCFLAPLLLTDKRRESAQPRQPYWSHKIQRGSYSEQGKQEI